MNTHHDRPASGPTRRQMPSHIISPHLTCLSVCCHHRHTHKLLLPSHEPAGPRWLDRPDSSPSTGWRARLVSRPQPYVAQAPPGNLAFLVQLASSASARKRGATIGPPSVGPGDRVRQRATSQSPIDLPCVLLCSALLCSRSSASRKDVIA